MRTLTGILLLLAFFQCTEIMAQKENRYIRKGNEKYYEDKFEDAGVDYMKALEKNPESVKGKHNLGTALYRQENYTDAAKLFENTAGSDASPEVRSNGWYNLGNSLLKEQKYQEAIEAYKEALRLQPGDDQARYNLEYARKMLQQQQQQQQNQQNQQNQQDKEQQDQKDQQNQQDQQQQNQDQQQQNQDQQLQNQNQQQPDNQNQSRNQNQQQASISKQEAERMLNALKNDENKTLEKVRLKKMQQTKKVSNEKDW
ncbi:MAG: hypothetical protein Kow00127_22810 [Bacteroidales bacterium]